MKCLFILSLIIAMAFEGYEQTCHTALENKFLEECEDYNNQVCYTRHKENCEDVVEVKCDAIQASKEERSCIEVSELVCSLKENPEFQSLQSSEISQICSETTDEEVCDTFYETTSTQKDKFQCIDINKPHCTSKAVEVQDKVCRTNVEFTCNDDNHLNPDLAYHYRGHLRNVEKNDCVKKNVTTCYDNPRFVFTTTCENKLEQVCEKLSDTLPKPIESQNCRIEQNEICNLDDKLISDYQKSSENYKFSKKRYRKVCVPVPKTVCDAARIMFLEPSCVPTSRKICKYLPEVNCDVLPEKFCRQVLRTVEVTKCD